VLIWAWSDEMSFVKRLPQIGIGIEDWIMTLTELVAFSPDKRYYTTQWRHQLEKSVFSLFGQRSTMTRLKFISDAHHTEFSHWNAFLSIISPFSFNFSSLIPERQKPIHRLFLESFWSDFVDSLHISVYNRRHSLQTNLAVSRFLKMEFSWPTNLTLLRSDLISFPELCLKSQQFNHGCLKIIKFKLKHLS
jgi:hypothetical protein